MPVLLDTHVLLWWLQADHRLTKHGRATIAFADAVFVSSASIWELAIKLGTHKIRLDMQDLASEIVSNGFVALAVTHTHAAQVAHLPLIHRDPFDRMLVAQAICESFKLLTADSTLASYTALVEII